MSQVEHKDVLFLSRVVDDCRKLDFACHGLLEAMDFVPQLLDTIGYLLLTPIDEIRWFWVPPRRPHLGA